MHTKRVIKIIGLTILSIIILIIILLITLFLIRLFSHREVDDISPQIPCSADIIKKSGVLWVIPEFNGIPISQNKSWCNYIISLNKTLGMHGIKHKYNEFAGNISEQELIRGMQEFEICFNQKPKLFKAPQLELSKENKILLEKNNLVVKWYFNQLTHKVYHCNNGDKFSNEFIDRF